REQRDEKRPLREGVNSADFRQMKAPTDPTASMSRVLVVIGLFLSGGFQGTLAAAEGLHKSVSNKEYPKSAMRENPPQTAGSKEGVLQLCGKDRRQDADSYERSRIVKIEAFFRGALREGTGFLISDTTV